MGGTTGIGDKRRTLRDLLVAAIRAGQFPAGSRLPSEWDLVTRYGVSRTTVRGALELMDAEGLLKRRKGQATWVHPEAEQRLAHSHRPPARAAIVWHRDKAMNPIFSAILESIHAHLPTHIHPTLFYHGEPHPSAYAAAAVVVIDGDFGPAAIAALGRHCPRLIVVNRLVDGLPSACTDNLAGGMLMARHAVERGHRRLGVLHFGEQGEEEVPLEFAQRLAGIRAVGAKAGAQLAEVRLPLKRMFEFGPDQAVDALLRQAPDTTCVLCVCDTLALAVLEALNARAVAVPRRMSLIGFDDLAPCRFISPALTSVRQPVEDIGAAVAAAVAALADGHPAGIGRPFTPQLIVRESCIAAV